MIARRPRSRRAVLADAGVAVFAGFAALAIYVRSLAPGLLWGDSAEFQFAAWLGGFAHPTGYPLYLMLGWLWTHLVPLRDPAFRMNLFSAVWGGVTMGLFALLVMRVLRFVARRDVPVLSPGASRLIAFGAALTFTFTPTFWSQAIIAEVYTLHAAFVAGIFLALLSWAERFSQGEPSRSWARLVALLFGLSLAHHRSTILLVPGAVLWILLVLAGSRRRVRLSPRTTAVLLASLLAPLLLYLYIPLAALHVAYARLPLRSGESLPLYDATLRGFLAHVSGSIFSSALVAPHAGLALGQVAGRFVDEVSLNGVLLGVFGLAALAFVALRRRSWAASAVLVLSGVFFLAQIAFNLFYAIGDIFVFYMPAYLVWVLWMAVGAWALVGIAGWLFAGAARWVRVAGSVLVFAALLALAYRSAVIFWPQVQRAGDDTARRAWDAILSSDLPRDAILVSNDRDEMAPLWYLTYVEGRRTDLTGLFPLIQPGSEWSNVARVTDSALRTGRAVYLVKLMPGLEVKYDLAPGVGVSVGQLGPIVHVRPLPSLAPQHPVDVLYGDAIRLTGYNLAPSALSAGQATTVVLCWQPMQKLSEDWTSYVQVQNASGDKVGQSDHRPGGVFYPSSLWVIGERLRDAHEVAIGADAPPGVYRLVVGLYVPEKDGLRRLGEPQVVGEVQIAR